MRPHAEASVAAQHGFSRFALLALGQRLNLGARRLAIIEGQETFTQISEATMTEIDKRHIVDNEVFTYRVSKDDKVFIYWYGKQVKMLKGKEAQRFISRIEHLSDQEAQLVMAKATGNFKRGNER